VINKDSAEHYTWGDVCEGWHLVRSEGLSVIQERMPPGASEVRHVHTRARQFFFVLAGAMTIEVAGEREELAAGDGVEIGPGVPHQVFNSSDRDVEFLVISQPPAQGDRVAIAPIAILPEPRTENPTM
jgi:mannose-6-phosphate isomerase-like protein (cupin superfamily)